MPDVRRLLRLRYRALDLRKWLKEEGHYFPQFSERVPDPKEFQLYLFQKVWEIFICCNMLSGSICYVFFNRKTIGPKKIELGRRGPKFQTIFF